MQSLTVPLTEQEKITLGNELENLFVVQDRPLNNARKAVLVKELADTGIPVRAISAGIRSLKQEDLKAIKLGTLIEASKDYFEGDYQATKCDECDSRGRIVARDVEGRWFALACRCPNGSPLRQGQRLATWGGGETHFVNGRLLKVA